MKIYNFLLLMLGISLVACSDYVDTEISSPVVASDNPAVRFAAENKTSFELVPNDASFTLTVIRSGSGSALQVPVNVVTNTEDSFIVPENVSFSAGSTTAELTINMTPNAPTAVPLDLQISFGDEYVDPYLTEYGTYFGEISILNWQVYAIGTFTSAYFGSSWEQELYRAENTDRYRFYDLYAEGVNYEFEWEEGKKEITPYGTPNASGYLVQQTGYIHSQYGMVSTATDPSPTYTFYDPATDQFTFERQWTVSAGSFGWLVDTFKITDRMGE